LANTELLGLEHPAETVVASPTRRSRVVPFARDLLALTKPRITALVLLTSTAGAVLAPGRISAGTWAVSLVGTALVVGAANALNMWWERDLDARMTRTRGRPLPAGRMAPEVALGFGLALACVSLPMLFAVNRTTGSLGLIALLTYVVVYTPLKRHSHLALLVGAVPGAIPPLLGWSTVTGGVGLGGVLLFAVLFLWQVPHFAAIAIFRAQDYARAGLKVITVVQGERAARHTIAVYGVLLAATSLLFTPLGLAGLRYATVAAVLDAAFLALALRGLRPGASFRVGRWAKQVFGGSIVYLTLLIVALLSNRGGP
jgi:protoheme IX farnesyltransferase